MSTPQRPLVLIVEDSRASSLLAQAVLARSGYRSQVVRSGSDLRAELKKTRPDVIVMDIQLPDIDGFALTKEMKAAPETARIPIVALTSRTLKEDASAASTRGATITWSSHSTPPRFL
jgi:chemosensory pili system protein ChpA (sensor histidine kinase/response regulator)